MITFAVTPESAKPPGREISFEELETVVFKTKASDWDRMASQFQFLELFEKLKDLRGIRLKKMFGGLAIYESQWLLFALMQDPIQSNYKNKDYGFPIWCGVLVCTDWKHHATLRKEISSLMPHPVLSKWLYLPMEDRAFSKEVKRLVELAREKPRRIGVKSKKSQRPSKSRTLKTNGGELRRRQKK